MENELKQINQSNSLNIAREHESFMHYVGKLQVTVSSSKGIINCYECMLHVSTNLCVSDIIYTVFDLTGNPH